MRVEKVKADPSTLDRFFNSELNFKKNEATIKLTDECLKTGQAIAVSHHVC